MNDKRTSDECPWERGRGRGVILTRGIVGRRDAVQWIVLEVVACLFSVVFCGSIICWEREGGCGGNWDAQFGVCLSEKRVWNILRRRS
jgi:hypothetical protein